VLDDQSAAPIRSAAKITDRAVNGADFPAGGGVSARGIETPVSVFKVFSATKARDREELGERVTTWVAANPHLEVRQTVVSLSSDRQFHCLSLVLICAVRP
jgi:hypothetical protein